MFFKRYWGLEMANKGQRKQGFTSFDTLMVLALGLTAVGISSSIIMDSLRDDRSERAQFGAEALAHQIASGGMAEMKNDAQVETSTNRGPASVPSSSLNLYEGELGKDPWGQPFHYKVVRSQDGRASRILVWSNGADQKTENNFSDSDIALNLSSGDIHFKGDDVGFIYDRK
jgi:hypothetical protein